MPAQPDQLSAPAVEPRSPVPQHLQLGPEPASPPHKRRWWLRLLIWAVLAAGAYGAYYTSPQTLPHVKAFAAKLSPKKETAAPPAARTVPVGTARARKGDMNLYLNGLGAVTAFNTVTIRSRVDGELIRVNFTEGQMVQADSLLAEIDPRPYQVQLAEAEAQLARDEAAMDEAQANLARLTPLRAKGVITQQEVETQTALMKQAEAVVRVDRGRIEDAQLQLSYTRITAPISGRIGLRHVDQGNMVHANDPNGLAVITQLQPIALIFTIPQDEIVRVQRKLHEGATLRVEAWDRDFKNKLGVGSLLALDNQVDPASGTVRLKAKFDNTDELLFPNQFVNVRLLVDAVQDAIIVPSAAVQRGPDSTFVYLVKDDSTVELRTITAGPSEGEETVITDGLAAGEVVVTDGLDKLQPGAKVAMRDAKAKDKRGSGAKDKEGASESQPSASGQRAAADSLPSNNRNEPSRVPRAAGPPMSDADSPPSTGRQAASGTRSQHAVEGAETERAAGSRTP